MLEILQETVYRKQNSFKLETYMNATTLSAFVLANGVNQDPNIEWTIIRTGLDAVAVKYAPVKKSRSTRKRETPMF